MTSSSVNSRSRSADSSRQSEFPRPSEVSPVLPDLPVSVDQPAVPDPREKKVPEETKVYLVPKDPWVDAETTVHPVTEVPKVPLVTLSAVPLDAVVPPESKDLPDSAKTDAPVNVVIPVTPVKLEPSDPLGPSVLLATALLQTAVKLFPRE